MILMKYQGLLFKNQESCHKIFCLVIGTLMINFSCGYIIEWLNLQNDLHDK